MKIITRLFSIVAVITSLLVSVSVVADTHQSVPFVYNDKFEENMKLVYAIGKEVGYFGLRVLSDTQLDDVKINVTGYPGDYARGTLMCTMEGPVKQKTNDRVYYDIDTAPGQSGSGVWALDNGEYDVVAVHAYGNDEGKNLNSGTRLNFSKVQLVEQWMKDLSAL